MSWRSFWATTGRTSDTIASIEIAPTGERVDLAINLDGGGDGQSVEFRLADTRPESMKRPRSGTRPPEFLWRPCRARRSVPGTRWRMNLYRIDGDGPDPQRRFLCWQPTCVVNRDPNHVPEAFGTLVFLPRREAGRRPLIIRSRWRFRPCVQSNRTSPRRVATRTASVRLVTPSFSKRCPRWVLTVRSEIPRAVAISLLL